jgi:hypothetical protein
MKFIMYDYDYNKYIYYCYFTYSAAFLYGSIYILSIKIKIKENLLDLLEIIKFL